MINCLNAPGAWLEMSQAFFAHDILMVRHYGFNELMPYFPDFAGDRDTIPLM